MGTLYDQIDSEKLPELEKYAVKAIDDNPKLVKAYREGKSALASLAEYAVKQSGGTVDESLVGEVIVRELERRQFAGFDSLQPRKGRR